MQKNAVMIISHDEQYNTDSSEKTFRWISLLQRSGHFVTDESARRHGINDSTDRYFPVQYRFLIGRHADSWVGFVSDT